MEPEVVTDIELLEKKLAFIETCVRVDYHLSKRSPCINANLHAVSHPLSHFEPSVVHGCIN